MRSSLAISVSVWKALLLREALARLFSRRAAWFWLLFEPIVHIAFLMLLFLTIRVRHVGGIETPLWIMIGLCTFFFFTRTERQASNAVSANKALFAYRQVKPVDGVFARSVLEGVIMTVVSVLIFSLAGLYGFRVLPVDSLQLLATLLAMWLIGAGFGMLSCVAEELTPELGRLLGLLNRPLYLASGLIFPIGSLPPAYREVLMLNPLAHGLELARLSFAPYYHAVPGTSLSYLWFWAAGLLLAGLLFQVGFAKRLVMQ